MKFNWRISTVLAVTLLVVLARAPFANASEIHVVGARAFTYVWDQLGPEFERTTGHKVKVTLLIGFKKQIDAVGTFDFAISNSPLISELVKEGKLIPSTRTDVMGSGIGVEVRAGAPKPDISSVEAFKRALLNPKNAITIGTPVA